MDFDKVIKKRRSIRSFKPKVASWKLVLDAIDSTIQGPFAGNKNNLKFLIIEEKNMIRDIAKNCKQSWMKESGILVVICSDDTQLENMYGERGRAYSKQQAGAAINTFLLKLVDLGLSGCWVGAFTDEIVRGKLKIPSHIQIEAIVPVGYERPVPKKIRRKQELENVLSWETWELKRRRAVIQELESEATNQN